MNALLDAGLVPGVKTEAFDAAIVAGSVVGTDPAAGTEVQPGSAVDYVVSLGIEPTPTPEPTPAPVVIPDLAGVVEADAVNALLDAGLVPGVKTEAFDAAIVAGSVVGTDPAAGTEVQPGSAVDYVVSLGIEPTPTPEPTPAPVVIPDLRGSTPDDAVNALLDLGLQPGQRTDRFNSQVTAGLVIRTDPAAGTEVQPGSAVDYVVSLGIEPTPTPEPTPAPVVIPDLAGVVEADAVNALLDAGLVPGVKTEAFDAAIVAGSVVGTDPAAGTEVQPGSAVDYVVSLGIEPTPTPEPTPAPVVIPDLAGVVEADAVNALLDAGLVPGVKTEAFDAAIVAGSVVGTDPAAGTEVQPGSAVDYVVSLGIEPTPTPEPTPAPVVIPDLRGSTPDDAVNALLDAGLQPGQRTDRFDSQVTAGLVIRTDPAAGTEVQPGSAVDYVVSLGIEPTPTPEPTPAPVVIPDLAGVVEADAVNALLDAGLVPGVKTEAFDAAIVAGSVVGTDPAAGTEVQPGSAVDYVVSLGIEPTPTPEPTPAPVVIPDLAGVVEADAVNALLDADLVPGVKTEAFDAAIVAGSVVGTDPAAGTEVQPGSAVDYVVSLGIEPTPTPEPTPAPVVIPDLRGSTPDDAVNALLDLGLQPGQRTDRFNSQVTAGLVIRTDPAAGTEVQPGSAVDYVVSLGIEPTPTPEPTPASVVVPNVRGMTPDDAVNALLDAGLQPGERQDRFNANVPEGQVIRTVPDAGTEVAPGTPIDYRVSLGAEPTTEPTAEPTAEPTVAPATDLVVIPDLRGSTPDDAVNALLDTGLQPGTRHARNNDNVPVGLVIRTDPPAGSEVALGTVVDYYVSRAPDATTEPTAAPTDEPAPTPAANTGIDPTIQSAIDAVVAQVPGLRELKPRQDVPYREITQKQFKKQVAQSFDEKNPPEQVAAEETLLKRLGLLPRDADLRQTMLDLYESQVAAYYDPKTGAMTVIRRNGDFGPEERLFVAHEYDHALQDQHWDLQKITDVNPSQGDRALARLALIEGDATSLMLQWAAQNLGPDELSQITSSMTPAQQRLLDGMPELLRRQLEFPYLQGQVFVSTLLGQGGWASVDAAFDQLPASTEQVLHPERYPADAPVKVSVGDVAATLGGGWSASYAQTMGELDISVLLANDGDPGAAAAAADGWGGDRLVSLEGPDGAWAVVWQTTWDSGSDADEFSAAVDPAMSSLDGAHVVLPGADISGGLDAPVLVLMASSGDTLQQVEGALGVGG